MNFKQTAVTFFPLLLLFLIPFGTPLTAQITDIRDCAGSCTANDVEVESVFLGDAAGNPIEDCSPGETVTAFIYVVITNNSNGNRRAIRFAADLYVDGVQTGSPITFCEDGPLTPGGTDVVNSGPITFTCGEALELRNLKVAWRTTPNATCANSTSCNNYPPGQCFELPAITIVAPLVADFTFACATTGGPFSIQFTDQTSGGTPPYTYLYQFGDPAMSTSTAPNPTFTYPNAGPFQVTLIVTDSDNPANMDTITQTVDIAALMCCALTVQCPPNPTGIFSCTNPVPAAATTEAQFEALGGVIGDNPCGTVVILSTTTTIDNCSTTTVTRTYTIFDDLAPQNGQLDMGETSFTCVQTFTYAPDDTPPMLTCPAPVTVQCASQVPAPDPASVTGVSDNCGGPVTVTFVSDVTTPGTCPNRFTVLRTYQAADPCGNTAICTQLITVNDVTAPVITCPAAITVECANLVPAPNPGSVTVGADNCGGPTTVTFVGDQITNQTCPNRYTLTRTYQVTDACGNTATCTQVITVFDDTAPVLSTAPANVTVQCDAVPAQAMLTATDNCGGTVTVTPTSTTIPGNCPDAYTLIRVWTATDLCGNTASVSQTVTVIDHVPPVLSAAPANVTVQCNAVPPQATLTATDNCDDNVAVVPTSTTIPGDCPNEYTLIRVWTATDDCGNSASVSQTVTVVDNSAPTITCPAPVTVSCASQVPAPNPGSVTVGADNCPGPVTVTLVSDVVTPGTCPNRFTVLRTYQAADACGNTATCTQMITVNDVTAPTLTCPAAVTVSCANQVPAPNPASVTATADNCGGPVTVTFVSDQTTPGTCPNRFTVLRTYRATDACGNSATCTQMITVNDVTAPTGTCPADITVSCIGDLPCEGEDDPAIMALIEQIELAYADNCGGQVTVTLVSMSELEECEDEDGGGIFNFSQTFRFEIADACGNVTLCEVAFTGLCQDFCTYTQGGWGNAGGIHSNGLNTVETLDSLIQLGPIMIGGGPGNCGFQVSTTACILGILPAGGPSRPLAENFMLDCNKKLKNNLAGQLITLELNLRYNELFNDSDLGAFALSCLFTPDQIEELGLDPDATIDDLIELANDFLASLCNGTTYPNGFGGTLTGAISSINEFWHDCEQPDPCDEQQAMIGNNGQEEASDLPAGITMHVYPDPAQDKINVSFTSDVAASVELRLFGNEGKLVRTLKVPTQEGENITEIDLSGLAPGIYWLNLTDRDKATTKRFVIMKP